MPILQMRKLRVLKATQRILTDMRLEIRGRDFPGGSVVKNLPAKAGDVGSIPGWGAKIPHVSWLKNQKIKEKQYCNKFNMPSQNSGR